MRLEEKIFRKMISTKKTLAIAESCTGGLLAHTITNVPGSSAVLILGITAYDIKAKEQILKIPSRILKQYGTISAEVAARMASGARRLIKTDYGIGITGIAGPGGGSAEQPVGLVYISCANSKETFTQAFHFKGSRLSIKKHAVNAAMDMLYKIL